MTDSNISIYFRQEKSNYVALTFQGQAQYYYYEQDSPFQVEEFKCTIPPPPFNPPELVIYEKFRSASLHPMKLICDIYFNGVINNDYVFQYQQNPPAYVSPRDYFSQAILRAAFQRRLVSYYYEDAVLVRNSNKSFQVGLLRFQVSTAGCSVYANHIQRVLLTDQFYDTAIILPLQNIETKYEILKRGNILKHGHHDQDTTRNSVEFYAGEIIDQYQPGFIQDNYARVKYKDTIIGYLDSWLHQNPRYTYIDLIPNVNFKRTLQLEKGLLEKLHGLVLNFGEQTGAFSEPMGDTSQLQAVQLLKYGVMDTFNTNVQAAEVLLRWGMNIQDYFNDNTKSTFGHLQDIMSVQTLSDVFAIQNAVFNAKFLTSPLRAIMFNPSVKSKLKAAKDMGIYFLTKASVLGLADRFGSGLFDQGFRTTGTQLALLNHEYPSINEFVSQSYETTYIQALVKAMGYLTTAAILTKLKNTGLMNANYHRNFNEVARNQFFRTYGPGMFNSALQFYNTPDYDAPAALLPLDIMLHSAGFNALAGSTYKVYEYGNFKKYLTKIMRNQNGEVYGDKSLYSLTVKDILDEFQKKYGFRYNRLQDVQRHITFSSYIPPTAPNYEQSIGRQFENYITDKDNYDKYFMDEFRTISYPSVYELVSKFGPKLLASLATGIMMIGASDYYRLRDVKYTEKELRALQAAKNPRGSPLPLVGYQRNNSRSAQFLPALPPKQLFYQMDPPTSMEGIVGRNNDFPEFQIDTSTGQSLNPDFPYTKEISNRTSLGHDQDTNRTLEIVPTQSHRIKDLITENPYISGFGAMAALGGAYYLTKKTSKDQEAFIQEKQVLGKRLKEIEVAEKLEKLQDKADPIKINSLRLTSHSRNRMSTFLFSNLIKNIQQNIEEEEMLTPYAKEIRKRQQERQRYQGLPVKRARR